jgi:hypothetical protein
MDREEHTMQLHSDYFSAYHNLKMTRDDKGVLVAEFHTNGEPFIMTESWIYRRWKADSEHRVPSEQESSTVSM